MDTDCNDYITLQPTVNPHKFIVTVMKYHKDDYVMTRSSQALSKPAAEALADSWAQALRLEIR